MQFLSKKINPIYILLFLCRYWVDFNIFRCFEKPWDGTLRYNAFAHLFLWKIMMREGVLPHPVFFLLIKLSKIVLNSQRKSLLWIIFFQRKNIGWGENPFPQHYFSQKEVRKCIISESPMTGLFKTSKNIKVNPIT